MISLITSDGHRERLKWSGQSKANPYGLGIVYFPDLKRRLFPDEFSDWVKHKGAVIVCSTEKERVRVAGALGVVALNLRYDCVISEGENKVLTTLPQEGNIKPCI